MNDELLSIQGVSQIGARHCSCSNNAHFVISVLQKLTLVHFDSISRQYSLTFHQLLMSKGEAEIPKLIAEMITEHYLVQRAFCKALVIGQAIPEMYP